MTDCTFKIFRNRLEATLVEVTLQDEQVTSAVFSKDNTILYLGTSKGYIRFINLEACLEADTEQEQKELLVELEDPFVISESGLPITSLNRFNELHIEDRAVMLVIVNDELAFIFSDGNR